MFVLLSSDSCEEKIHTYIHTEIDTDCSSRLYRFLRNGRKKERDGAAVSHLAISLSLSLFVSLSRLEVSGLLHTKTHTTHKWYRLASPTRISHSSRYNSSAPRNMSPADSMYFVLLQFLRRVCFAWYFLCCRLLRVICLRTSVSHVLTFRKTKQLPMCNHQLQSVLPSFKLERSLLCS